MIAPDEVTKPQAGVITTRPATAPEQNPSTLGLPRVIHSAIGHTKDATAVARVVVIKALAATPSAAAQPETPAVPAADGAAAPAATPDSAAVAPAPVAAMAGFAGDIDELQIGKVARTAGFIKIAAIGQGPDQAKLVSFSVDEETASWLSGYFAVILKSAWS